jgi:hypothetical protein
MKQSLGNWHCAPSQKEQLGATCPKVSGQWIAAVLLELCLNEAHACPADIRIILLHMFMFGAEGKPSPASTRSLARAGSGKKPSPRQRHTTTFEDLSRSYDHFGTS